MRKKFERVEVTPKNLDVVVERLISYVKRDDGDLKEFCGAFDEFLDHLANNDFFGTEMQCDPRGDRRG